VFGDPGRGKTAAVRMALHEVPAGWKVAWVPVPDSRSHIETAPGVTLITTLGARFVTIC
jgi:KaiC/GvpD/RAD55 family RecA-like ATPase